MIYSKVETRFDYQEIETSNPKEMYGKYLAKPVIKKFMDKFKDADTGEDVEIERCEMLFHSGKFIDGDLLAKIKFSMLADGIQSVTVSTQLRTGSLTPNSFIYPYIVQMNWGSSAVKLLLRAQNLQQAIDIATDFSELNTNHMFDFTSVKQLGGFIITENLMRIDENPIINRYASSDEPSARRDMLSKLCSDILPVNMDIDEEAEERMDKNRSWFQLQVEYGTYDINEIPDASTAKVINVKDAKKECATGCIEVSSHQYIVYADSAMRAMEIVSRLVHILINADNLKEHTPERKLYIAMQKAMPIPVSHYVPYEFTLAYTKNEYFNK